MNCIFSILLSIASSIIASAVFWILLHKITRANIEYSKVIVKSENNSKYRGEHLYRIRLINSGSSDLTEVRFIVRLSIEGTINEQGTSKIYTFLGVGIQNTLPILRGKRYQCKENKNRCAHTLTLFPIDVTYRIFQNRFHPRWIQNKARRKTLSLTDIFNLFGEAAKITIFTYGNDSVTGARKTFKSEPYSINNIKKGNYNQPGNVRRIGYKKYVANLLSIATVES